MNRSENHLPRGAISRRDLVRLLAATALVPFTGCESPSAPDPWNEIQRGRLRNWPGERTESMAKGKSEFAVSLSSSAVLYVPESVDPDVAAPLLVFLHGASRTVDAFVDGHKEWLDATGVIMLAPYAANGGSWDAVMGLGFLEDPLNIDEALEKTYRNWTIDPDRVALAGFSEGATYSLALGRVNGDHFCRVVAYAPGGLLQLTETHGKPPILITHGTSDAFLPFTTTATQTVPSLRAQGYTVDFREWDGPHAVPAAVAQEVVEWLAQ